MPGFDNQTMFADNVDFTGNVEVAATVTTDGQLLIGSTVAPNIRVGTLSASGGIVITTGNGTINIDGSGAGGSMIWNAISASQTLSNQNGYLCVGGGTLSLLLPPVSVLGDIIEITIDGSAGFTVTQGAGQSIKFGNQATTIGVGGSISATGQGDTIRMVCHTANLKWNILSCMGNLTFV